MSRAPIWIALGMAFAGTANAMPSAIQMGARDIESSFRKTAV